MNRILTVAATSFVLLTGAAGIASAQPDTLIAQDTGKPLTITAAKNQVTSWLSATGHSVLHVGQAEFDRQGNVKVEIDNPTGTPYTHVLVHAVDGTITDARSGVAGNKG